MNVSLHVRGLGRVGHNRLALAAILLVGTLVAVYTVVIHEHFVPRTDLVIALQLLNVLSYLIAGVLAWWRHPSSRTGPLMVLTAFAFLILQVQIFPSPTANYIGNWFGGLPHVLLAHLILTYPTGRFDSTWDRTLIISAYVLVIGLGFLFNHPVLVTWMLWTGVVITFLVVLLAIRRWVRAREARRRILRPLPFSAAIFATAGTANAVAAYSLTFGADLGSLYQSITNLLTALSPLVPVAFLFGFGQTTRLRGALGNLVIQLENVPEPGHLRDAVARTLRDPSLELAFWVPDRSAYIDAEGHQVTLPENDPGRLVTTISHGGEKLAAIVHDVALAEERELVDAVLAAARMALVNERLQAQVRAQLEEVRRSRARIVEAGDAERRRIERDLHDGAQQRLVSLSLALKLIESRARTDAGEELAEDVAHASRELKGAIEELRELAQGLHPTILTERGLGPALEGLAERAPVAVSVAVPEERFPPQIEAAAYFTVAEALTNVAKHAHASKAAVVARVEGSELVVVVSDDGVGGTDVAGGTGLTGLADRVAAVGGSFRVASNGERGTRIEVNLPCG